MDLLRKLFFSLLVIVTITACRSEYNWHGSPYQEPHTAPPIPLMTTNGELFNLKEHLDKPILIYFGYTYCPDICPATLVQVRQIVDQLGLNPEDYLLVMVTVDPERDTPEVLEKYLSRYEMSHVGLWGSAEELAPVLESYGVFAEKDPSDDPENYTMSHTARLFLIDKAGVLRTNYNFGTPEIEIQQDLEYILGE